MKKIGILTLTASDNVGSLLQAYALQNIIDELGYSAELINLETKKSKKLYGIIKPSLIKRPKHLLNTVKNYKKIKMHKKDYILFRKKYIKQTLKSYENYKQLSEIKDNYNAVVCGSDQIWNVDMYDFDNSYFLGWAKDIPKISYAASLGGQEKIEAKQELRAFKNDIESFKNVSVREDQGRKTLELFTDKKVEVCADPTLVIDAERWNEMTKDRMIDGDYIFYYSYNYGQKELNELVKKASKKHGMPVYVINIAKWLDSSPEDYGFIMSDKGGPEAFLNLMRYAKYSYVESLHGTIFAYIFRKNFWFLNRRFEDKLDHRSEFILKSMDLRGRTLRPNNFDEVNIEEPIDYATLNCEMKKWTEKSYKFLKEALKDVK